MKNYMKKFATILTTLALVVVLGVCLSACGSNNGSKELSKEQYEANLKAAEYEVEFLGEESLKMDISETESFTAEWVISAEKGEYADKSYTMVRIAKFSNTSDAEKIVDAFNKQMEERFKDIPDYVTEEEIAEAKKGSVIARVDSVVFIGYQAAIDIAQGK